MADQALMAHPLRSTPAELKSRPGVPRELPEDLLRQASQRLRVIALVGAALWIVAPAAYHLATRAQGGLQTRWTDLGTPDVVAIVSALLSVTLFLYLRREHDPRFVVNLGLAHMMTMAFSIGVAMHWGPRTGMPLPISPTITWIGPVILIYAAIVPAPPRKMAIAAFIAASMDLVGMQVGRAAGLYTFGSMADAFVMHYPNFMMAGVAVVVSRVMTGLGRQVSKAREMGSYQLGELLGRGGMGEVYRATHRMLARPAAIKLIRPEMINAGDGEMAQTAVKRFRREAEVAASLRSPHTVELYDFGLTDDNILYFVMEFLEGMDLETLVTRHGPAGAARTIHILVQVCESLEEAHERGLVHRDIKPANVHIGRLGVRSDFVKVLDFGLVKSVVGSTGEHSLATAAGLTPGTPAYMAPEMAMGEDVDGRADLYALGCVGYYLLTGQRVFDGINPLQIIAQHLTEAPVPPSQRTELPIPPALERIVMHCLAKKPGDRPQRAADLARDLAAVQLDEPWTETRALKWWSVNRPAP